MIVRPPSRCPFQGGCLTIIVQIRLLASTSCELGHCLLVTKSRIYMWTSTQRRRNGCLSYSNCGSLIQVLHVYSTTSPPFLPLHCPITSTLCFGEGTEGHSGCHTLYALRGQAWPQWTLLAKRIRTQKCGAYAPYQWLTYGQHILKRYSYCGVSNYLFSLI